MGNNQGRGKVSGYLVSRAVAGPVVCKVQVLVDRSRPASRELPSPALGGAGPMATFCLSLGLPALQTACRPPTSSNPMPLLMLFQPLGAPLPLPELAL